MEIMFPVLFFVTEIQNNEKDRKPEEEEQIIHEDERPSKKIEFSRRKRSKSEDMDNVQSKRRRYMEEEYEAEFQVKITAKGDINQKLQKVVQWLLEEKLRALQCAVFDKTLAELKTRVEKIECNKRHKTVLTELQAKIARLTKRFGAAKEDLKKRQENPPNPPVPVSPGKPVVEVTSNNTVPYSTSSPAEQSSTTTPRIENQTNKTIDASVKKAADSTSQFLLQNEIVLFFRVEKPQEVIQVVSLILQWMMKRVELHKEPPRPVHPAPLPEAPQPPRLPPEAASTSLPQKPHLKLARVQSQNGIVLSWSVLEVDRTCATVDSYHLYAYHEEPSATVPSQWKKIGEVKALPLPMACTLTQFVSGSKYYFAVRAKDIYGRFGPFSRSSVNGCDLFFPEQLNLGAFFSSLKSSTFWSCFNLVHGENI
ncbi:hypothetical protein QTO34_017764 [Cnephaeus nilssonii]|uniref:Fibronectin type-III domain-containing protein n=1 Tax=Cnephaeus nilssonii TaxID=3371016 RepID=A0AA40I1L3_CNENI|nr:hypothetical protein QTO34_017764 [Eptesicus nilssonii]